MYRKSSIVSALCVLSAMYFHGINNPAFFREGKMILMSRKSRLV